MSNWKTNPVTNQLEMSLYTKLISVGDKFILSNSESGAKYKVATVELPNGKQRSARIYENNLIKGMPLGQKYLSTASQYADNAGNILVDLRVSHITGAERATLEDFGSEPVGVTNTTALTEQSV